MSGSCRAGTSSRNMSCIWTAVSQSTVQDLEYSLASNAVPGPSEPRGELANGQAVYQDMRVCLYKTRTMKWSHQVGMADEVWHTVTSSYCHLELISTQV